MERLIIPAIAFGVVSSLSVLNPALSCNAYGMAANMIGVKKAIIVVAAGSFQFAMVNPVITKKLGAFQTEEGCLSLEVFRLDCTDNSA